MKRTLLLAVAAVLLVSTLSGCMSKIYREPLREDEAERMADEAVESLNAGLTGFEGGDWRRMEATISTGTASGAELVGPIDLTMVVAWGANDVRYFRLDVQMAEGWSPVGPDGELGDEDDGPPEPVTVEVYCASDRHVFVIDQAYESRPLASCLDFSASENEGGTSASPDVADGQLVPLKGLLLQDIEVEDHRFVTATYEDENGNTVIIELDAKGRPERVTSHGIDGEAEMTFEYGAKRNIEIPSAAARLPAAVEFETETLGDFGSGGSRLTITSAEHILSLGEYEVRMGIPDYSQQTLGGPAYSSFVATFDLVDGEVQTEGQYQMMFHDVDGDGMLGTGDWLETSETADPANKTFAQPVLWDRWADAAVGTGIPGPAAPLVLLAMLGVALLLGRRLRD